MAVAAFLIAGSLSGSLLPLLLLRLRRRTSAVLGLFAAALTAGVTFGGALVAMLTILAEPPALPLPYFFAVFTALCLIEIPTIATEHAAGRYPRLTSAFVGLFVGAVTVAALG